MVLAVPFASVSLVGRDYQWIRRHDGSGLQEDSQSTPFSLPLEEHSVPLIIEDALLDERFADLALLPGNLRMRSYAGVPIRNAAGRNVGVLCAMNTQPHRFDPADIAMLSSFANVVSNEVQLRMTANTDYLTGALTRRGFKQQVDREMSRSIRYQRQSSILLFDIDHFKSINDSFGHAAGDEVLRQIGKLISTALRPADIFGRLGGEEFGLLLAETNPRDAFVVAERFRTAIQNHDFAIPGGSLVKATASFGVSPIATFHEVEEWFSNADKGLYEAKMSGRNCTRMRLQL